MVDRRIVIGASEHVHYAVSMGEQARVVSAICGQAEAPIVAVVQIAAFAPSFESLASTTPACAQRRVR